MNRTVTYIGAGVVAAAVVAGVIFSLQNFDAEKIACEDIAGARANLQAMYDAGVNASVQIFAESRAAADEALSQCLGASPADPCADAQRARDAAVAAYEGISAPSDNAPYAEFNQYFQKRTDAYNNYKKAKDALDQCRAANPPKGEMSYEKSDTKKCFDAYDAAQKNMSDVFTRDTQAMRAALKAALAALDAREKACHPPEGKEKFTEPPQTGGSVSSGAGGVAVEIASCRPISPELDSELFLLRQRAAVLPGEIQVVQDSIHNVQKRMSSLQRDLQEVDTYIPPESTRTQFEGALNALRAERKVAIESALEFYKNMLSRRQAEKAALEKELSDLQAQIAARLSQIQKENEARQRNFPTALHQAKPDKCAYYHCHGMLCGRQDPAPQECGHGSTSPDDTQCEQFFKSYLEAAGV